MVDLRPQHEQIINTSRCQTKAKGIIDSKKSMPGSTQQRMPSNKNKDEQTRKATAKDQRERQANFCRQRNEQQRREAKRTHDWQQEFGPGTARQQAKPIQQSHAQCASDELQNHKQKHKQKHTEDNGLFPSGKLVDRIEQLWLLAE